MARRLHLRGAEKRRCHRKIHLLRRSRRRRPSIAEHRRRMLARILSKCKLGRLKQFGEEWIGRRRRRPTIAERRPTIDERRRYSRRAEERRRCPVFPAPETWPKGLFTRGLLVHKRAPGAGQLEVV